MIPLSGTPPGAAPAGMAVPYLPVAISADRVSAGPRRCHLGRNDARITSINMANGDESTATAGHPVKSIDPPDRHDCRTLS